MTASALWVAFGAGMLAGIYVYALWAEPVPPAKEGEPVNLRRYLRKYRRAMKAAAKARGIMASTSAERSEGER
jgi:hypothetical protein